MKQNFIDHDVPLWTHANFINIKYTIYNEICFLNILQLLWWNACIMHTQHWWNSLLNGLVQHHANYLPVISSPLVYKCQVYLIIASYNIHVPYG